MNEPIAIGGNSAKRHVPFEEFAQLAGITEDEWRCVQLGREAAVDLFGEHGWPAHWKRRREIAGDRIRKATHRFGEGSPEFIDAERHANDVVHAAKLFHRVTCRPLAARYRTAHQQWNVYCKLADKHPAHFKMSRHKAARDIWTKAPAELASTHNEINAVDKAARKIAARLKHSKTADDFGTDTWHGIDRPKSTFEWGDDNDTHDDEASECIDVGYDDGDEEVPAIPIRTMWSTVPTNDRMRWAEAADKKNKDDDYDLTQEALKFEPTGDRKRDEVRRKQNAALRKAWAQFKEVYTPSRDAGRKQSNKDRKVHPSDWRKLEWQSAQRQPSTRTSPSKRRHVFQGFAEESPHVVRRKLDKTEATKRPLVVNWIDDDGWYEARRDDRRSLCRVVTMDECLADLHAFANEHDRTLKVTDYEKMSPTMLNEYIAHAHRDLQELATDRLRLSYVEDFVEAFRSGLLVRSGRRVLVIRDGIPGRLKFGPYAPPPVLFKQAGRFTEPVLTWDFADETAGIWRSGTATTTRARAEELAEKARRAEREFSRNRRERALRRLKDRLETLTVRLRAAAPSTSAQVQALLTKYSEAYPAQPDAADHQKRRA